MQQKILLPALSAFLLLADQAHLRVDEALDLFEDGGLIVEKEVAAIADKRCACRAAVMQRFKASLVVRKSWRLNGAVLLDEDRASARRRAAPSKPEMSADAAFGMAGMSTLCTLSSLVL